MKRRVVVFLSLAAAVMAAAQGGAPLPAAWKHWKYSTGINAPEDAQASFWSIVIPSRIAARAQADGADLRVIDPAGTEVPFVIRARREKRIVSQRSGRLFDVSFKPGANTQGVVDLGAQPGEHNSLIVETSESNYFTHVELASSHDARDWRIVRHRAPIYRFASEGLDGNQTVRYPVSRARYLRVRILQGENQFPLTGARIEQETVEEAEMTEMESVFTRDAAPPALQSWWRADLGHSHNPISSVRFGVEQSEFHRAVRISTTDTPENPRSWRAAGEGDLYRYRRGGELLEKLVITLPETRARHWRVEVFNRNDPELAGLRIALFATPRRVVFPASGKARRLLYGNAAAQAASYELARVNDETAFDAAAAATLGAEEQNPAYEDPFPLPWSERHPYILWGALLLAVGVLGALAVRSLQKS